MARACSEERSNSWSALGRTLISQDAGWYHVGEPGGGTYRGYTFLYTDFVPKLEPSHAAALLWDNPRAAFGAS